MREQFLYQNPVGVGKTNNPSQDIHWHENFEVITVLSGLLNLQIGFEKFILNPGDVMVVNSRESHSFTSLKKDTDVIFLSLDQAHCLKINPFFYESIAISDYSVGFAQLQENQEKITKSIVALLKSLPHEDFHSGIDKIRLLAILERLEDLLSLISTSYKPRVIKGGVLTVAPEEKINMLYRMINYLYANYNKAPSLDDFLKKEHYSLYHMSHVIPEITGTSFRDWLTYVRVEQSEKLLLTSDAAISAIAQEVGFSSARYYNANFTKWYGVTPVNFRRLYKHEFDEGVLTPSGDLIVARSFLRGYPDHTADESVQQQTVNRHKETNETGSRLLTIDMKPGGGQDEPLVIYPRQACLIHLGELSCEGRWEHLAWVKREIGFDLLRILTPPDTPVGRLPGKEVDLLKHLSEYAPKNHTAYPELNEIKVSLETQAGETDRLRGQKPFELLNPGLILSQLVTAEGRKTPDFFFYALLSRFRQKKVAVTPWSLTAKSENQLLVFIAHREAFSLDHQRDEFTIRINGIRGDYKLTTYKCDLDFFHSDRPIKDVNILGQLTLCDYKRLNAMYEPRMTFERVSFHNHGEFRFLLTGNTCRLFSFDRIA